MAKPRNSAHAQVEESSADEYQPITDRYRKSETNHPSSTSNTGSNLSDFGDSTFTSTDTTRHFANIRLKQ